MIELDTSLLAPEITYILMLRGAGVPPVKWDARPNETAKEALESTDDAKLFARNELADKKMAAAARALLYLWNGWTQEAATAAKSAPEKERWYILGLCQRHMGKANQAQTSFQAMDGHPIFEPLAQYAVKTINSMGTASEKAVNRFKQLMEFDPVWKPFTFTDLCEMARAEKVERIGQELICTLQCREWEILFTHCYEAAIGEKLAKKPEPKPQAPDRRRMLEKRRAKAKRRQYDYMLDEGQKSKAQRGTSRAAPTSTVPVRCPKCRHIQQVPESLCGNITKCVKCGKFFGIPHKHAASGTKKA